MERLHLPRTDKTPEVTFDPATGSLRMEGSSIHENAERFFRPLLERVEAYIMRPLAHTQVVISLDYFNSSSSKYLLDLLKLLDEVQVAGRGTVELEWQYAPDDLDMKEAGEDYGVLLELPVRLVSVPLR